MVSIIIKTAGLVGYARYALKSSDSKLLSDNKRTFGCGIRSVLSMPLVQELTFIIFMIQSLIYSIDIEVLCNG